MSNSKLSCDECVKEIITLLRKDIEARRADIVKGEEMVAELLKGNIDVLLKKV